MLGKRFNSGVRELCQAVEVEGKRFMLGEGLSSGVRELRQAIEVKAPFLL